MNVPSGLHEKVCRDCGLRVWQARLDPSAQAKAGWRSQFIFVAPYVASPERGDLMMNNAGLAVFTRPPRYPGDLERHRCPGRITRCKYCGEPVRVLTQAPGTEVIMAVVDAEPDPRSFLVVNELGYLVRDPEHVIEGARYRWHTLH